MSMYKEVKAELETIAGNLRSEAVVLEANMGRLIAKLDRNHLDTNVNSCGECQMLAVNIDILSGKYALLQRLLERERNNASNDICS